MQLYEEGPRSHFHCYACGAHGDIFHLTQQVKKLDFRSTVDWLTQEYHLTPLQSSRSSRKFKTPRPVSTGFFQALEIYLQYSNRADLENWLERRHLSFDLIEKAQLVLAEPNILSKTAESSANREMLGILEDVGMVRSNFPTRPDKKIEFLNLIYSYQDFFGARRRIVFPINDVSGNLQGFAGRLYEDVPAKDGPPKYLYTPKLPRAELLYRAEHAFKRVKAKTLQEAQSRTLYLCEGLLDALRLESLGLPAVALLGAQASGKQIDCLVKLNGELSGTLRCAVFLDRDDAGRRGAAQTIGKLTEESIESVFIWSSPAKTGKDPEEVLRDVSSEQAKQLLNDWSNPAALALLSNSLQLSPDEILDDEKWDLLSPGRRYWAISTLRKHQAFLLSQFKGEQHWQRDTKDYLSLRKANIPIIKTWQETESDNQRLALAIDLAEAGARRGELPSDMAAWRRIELASTAFYEAFKTRLRQDIGLPLEPFDAVYVSRGFGKAEHRLKAMPCPEDLIVQQYLLNELLNDNISPFIPAVRYYRSEGRTVTTCETETGDNTETLSFAYQIDMDVVQGRRPPSDQGIFRHYFECWQEFNTSIKLQSANMSQIHCLRLDLSRYYDNLRRIVVRDALRKPLRVLFDELEQDNLIWFELFQPHAPNRADRLADWLCDQSFGYCYYHPATGEPRSVDEFKGIPQGPVLSAWIATIALFPLDAALRRVLERYNTDGQQKVGYARYVDDVVLLADNQELLSVLRATAEEVANSLFVELRQKGDPTPPMRREEFIRYLTEGRALPEYGPMEELELFPIDIGDGETGWGIMHGEEAPPRYAALHLLRDARLYTASSELLHNQIYTALQADELRPGDLGKATRWLWYDAAKSENASVNAVWHSYWASWHKVTHNVSWILDTTQHPWDDPAFYALEGLEKLLEAAPTFGGYQLSIDEEYKRKERLYRLADFASDAGFYEAFKKAFPSDLKPQNWSEGIEKLSRQFWQRAVSLRWKACHLASKNMAHLNGILKLTELTDSLRASLTRARLTDAESCGNRPLPIAETNTARSSKNPLSEAILLFHEAYVRLGVKNGTEAEGQEDLLAEIAASTQQLIRVYESSPFYDPEDRFVELLSYFPLRKQQTRHRENSQISEAAHLALEVLAEITPRDRLMSLLANRPALLASAINAIPLPPLPGVPMPCLLLVEAEQLNQHGLQKISLLKRIRQSAQDQKLIGAPELDFWAVQAKEESEVLTLEWKKEKTLGKYLLESANWTSTANLIHFSPPSFEIGANALSWTAAVYEALVKLSHTLGKEIECVPAWPYIAANHWPGKTSDEALAITLITPSVQRTQLGRHAFIRDGQRGLRPIPIPEDFAHLWRIGVALTDSLGFISDLDRFSPIDDSHAKQDDLANYLLRTVLSKLRGWFLAHGRYPVVLDQGQENLPKTIKRSLSLLRSYDDTDCKLASVLSAISESQAMAIRMNEEWCNQPGYATYFMQRIGQQVAIRMPRVAAEDIPEINISPTPLLRSTVWAWNNLRLRLSQTQTLNTENNVDWCVLLAGLGLTAVTDWLRALALELEADGLWPLPSSIDVAAEWEIEEALLTRGFDSEPDFIETFRNGNSDFQKKFLEDITPLGWLVLVAGHMGLIGNNSKVPLDYELLKSLSGSNSDPNQAIQQLRDKTKKLAHRLAPPVTKKADPELWPFEYITEFFNADTDCIETFVSEAFELLISLERLCGFQITSINNVPWRFEPREHKFTDADSITWKFQPWQITLAGGSKPVTFEHGGRYLSQWTETRNKNGRLLSVSAISEPFGKLVSKQPSETDKKPLKISVTSDQDTSFTSCSVKSTDHSEADSTHNTSRRICESDNKSSASPTPDDADRLRENWLEHQNVAWNIRQHRTENHVRLAFIQWKVDDSYRHPLFELAVPEALEKEWYGKSQTGQRKKERSIILNCAKDRLKDKQSSDNGSECANKNQLAQAVAEADQGCYWTYSAMLPSWAEHRRRKLLEEVLRACDGFKVDVLVLPEYSVRPDTVKWLKEKLEQTSSQVTILAGTYRLYGRSHEPGFETCYSEILGVADFEKIFPNDRTNHTNLISSGERSSILSLLLPIEQNGSSFVSAFTRRKKYPAMAANEIFNPGIDLWRPLFTLEALLQDLQQRDLKTGKRLKSPRNDISAGDFLRLLTQVKCERYLAELICSELFVLTSPANWNNIASEYGTLLKRFGRQDKINSAHDIRHDLWEFARYLGINGRSPMEDTSQRSSSGVDIPRRSIILLPAMTSRSADYWIFGQSALLAAGITTVFCNAVADKDSVGGSCVIGRESWKDGKSAAGMISPITPYSGWSRGIYYNDKKDALGEKEQAMVIVDIDPVHMMEGKPRPQALPVPLQLVAHLPLVETIDWVKSPNTSKPENEQNNAIKKAFFDTKKLGEQLKQFENFKHSTSQVWNPDAAQKTAQLQNRDTTKESETIYRWAEDLASSFSKECGNKAAFEERLQKWRQDWRELPFAGYPPAIMDWLWVDLTPPINEEDFPKIFVPSWISDV